MHMPFTDVGADAEDVKAFIEQVKSSFESAIKIYERTVARYAFPVEKDNLFFEFRIGNSDDRPAEFALSDDRRY